MHKFFWLFMLLFFYTTVSAQADNEIQVYASPITAKNVTFLELHSNYTFRGMDGLIDPKSAHYLNESVEITHGFGGNFEMGIYFFTAVVPGQHYEYLGTHIRPRFTAPAAWHLPFGASLSAEFGFLRPSAEEDFICEGEIRPIIDKTFSNWYFSFNPNMDFALTGNDKHLGLTPQFKTVYTIQQKVGVGFEYYATLGTFHKIFPGDEQEHLIGPMVDLYTWSDWEFNSGYLFGLTPGSNHGIFKLLVGHRFGK
ncbi:MAG TPA: hypothetical protein VFS36_03660 [Chitinophagaceae bacterium]|jgi:hypothetical protein|nr:hypothetical protein [Chitinophagaceae bacterium]